jgi:hypothetical protein
MVSIHAVLARIKEDWRSLLSIAHLESVCREVGLDWRERVLDPASTILIFLLQILHGNAAISNLPRLAGILFTPGAYCQARQRLPLAALRRLLNESGLPLREPAGNADPGCAANSRSAHSLAARSRAAHTRPAHSRAADARTTHSRSTGSRAARSNADGALWLGHRVFLLDASSCSMPDTPALQKKFGQPGGQKKGCGFPVANLLMLVDAYSGLVLDVLISPLRTHDLRRAAELHPHLRAGDVAAADRAFCSYSHVALLFAEGVFALFRMHQRLRDDGLRWFDAGGGDAASKDCKSKYGKRKCGKSRRRNSKRARANSAFELLEVFDARKPSRDQLVMWHKPVQVPKTMTAEQHAALPVTLVVRIVRYAVRWPGFRTRHVKLLTTLLDPKAYPAEALAELYGRRWQIEVNFRHLKQTLGLDVVRCQSVAGVEKEIVMFALVYNLVRTVMLAEAERRGVPPDRVSFVDALRHLRSPPTPEGDPLPLLINPHRPGRAEPRVRKRRPKQYPRMTEPRRKLRKKLLRRGKAA